MRDARARCKYIEYLLRREREWGWQPLYEGLPPELSTTEGANHSTPAAVSAHVIITCELFPSTTDIGEDDFLELLHSCMLAKTRCEVFSTLFATGRYSRVGFSGIADIIPLLGFDGPAPKRTLATLAMKCESLQNISYRQCLRIHKLGRQKPHYCMLKSIQC